MAEKLDTILTLLRNLPALAKSAPELARPVAEQAARRAKAELRTLANSAAVKRGLAKLREVPALTPAADAAADLLRRYAGEAPVAPSTEPRRATPAAATPAAPTTAAAPKSAASRAATPRQSAAKAGSPGRARTPASKKKPAAPRAKSVPLQDRTRAELATLAAERGIAVTTRTTKAQLLAALSA
jgi:hypothetical protein